MEQLIIKSILRAEQCERKYGKLAGILILALVTIVSIALIAAIVWGWFAMVDIILKTFFDISL